MRSDGGNGGGAKNKKAFVPADPNIFDASTSALGALMAKLDAEMNPSKLKQFKSKKDQDKEKSESFKNAGGKNDQKHEIERPAGSGLDALGILEEEILGVPAGTRVGGHGSSNAGSLSALGDFDDESALSALGGGNSSAMGGARAGQKYRPASTLGDLLSNGYPGSDTGGYRPDGEDSEGGMYSVT